MARLFGLLGLGDDRLPKKLWVEILKHENHLSMVLGRNVRTVDHNERRQVHFHLKDHLLVVSFADQF